MISNVGSTSLSNGTSAATNSLAQSGFSKETFLKLLVTQLKYQDPMNPQDSSQFVAELANFSSLEQMTTLNKSMESVLEMSVANLVGKTATVADTSDPSGYITGKVDGIQYYADGPALKINGKDYSFSQVQSIS